MNQEFKQKDSEVVDFARESVSGKDSADKMSAGMHEDYMAINEEDTVSGELSTASEVGNYSKACLKQQKDIIEAFRREQELGEVRMDFISKMSHDIRTPLNAIVGMTMIARNELDNKETLEDCLAKIEAASDQMLNLVNGLLDIGRAEHDKQSVANVPFDIAEVVESISSIAEPLADAKHHVLSVRTESITHEMVSGDVQRILRITNNLVSNAINYTPNAGHISVVLSEGEEREDGRFDYKITVTDDGYGMSEDFLKKIYDPFVRGVDERVSDSAGTGLGMAITRSLVEMIGGTIDIRSEINVGTQVVVNFPLTIYRMGNSTLPSEAVAQGLLVLCDHSMCEQKKCTASGRCFKDVLEEHGIPVDMASNIDAARFMIDAKRSKKTDYYAVIINAEQYTEEIEDLAIKLRISLGAAIPIVLVLNRDWLSIELDARSKGVNFFLKRPVFMKSFFEVLNRIHESQISEEEVEQKRLPNCAGKRVLIVEDNEINAQILSTILSTSGTVIDWVEDGKAALEAVRDMPSDWYDIIFMDIEMPVMNGYEASKAIRNLEDRDKSRKPIVAMTANAFSSDASRAREAGMSDHLTKPVQIDKLSEVLRRYLA